MSSYTSMRNVGGYKCRLCLRSKTTWEESQWKKKKNYNLPTYGLVEI